jgi:hypothetical protein
VESTPVELSAAARDALKSGLQSLDRDFDSTGLRMISLRGLEKKIAEHKAAGDQFPPELLYMAGLQRIEYVIVSPETNDLIIAGPGEGITTNKQGQVVGSVSGMPPIHLEDFLVALRHVNDARSGYGISVSIDPTEEGLQRVNRLMRQLDSRNFGTETARALEEAGGPQQITLTGVPKESRFAQVLVSADYKMKRLAMGFEPAPEYLPSILAMAQSKNRMLRTSSPRFWMETFYQPVSVSSDKNVWKLNGQAIRTKTAEEDSAGGDVQPSKLAKSWADAMTENFEPLCNVQPVFRELRNLFDVSVIAAIIAREKLLDRVNLDLPAIAGTEMVSTPNWNVPKSVPTQCSFARLAGALLITTSGGVTLDSWAVAGITSLEPKLNGFADEVLVNRPDRWWWNSN